MSQLYIDAGLLTNKAIFKKSLNTSRVVIVTDPIVAGYYLEILLSTLAEYDIDVVVIDAGEQNKTWQAIDKILSVLAEQQHDRFSSLISLGGGVVGDLSGFAASIYMRGINLIHVPTTLLAQIDSCIGGKTGCNFLGIKNLIGTFYQPKAIIIDSSLIQTLPAREYTSGFAEMVKYGVACDANFFSWLEQNFAALKLRDAAILQMAIQSCCTIKALTVKQDVHDHDQRMVLNFGHTFAHALEAATEFNHYLHGEAVALGMLLATWLAVKLGYIEQILLDRLFRLLAAFQLPTKWDSSKCNINMLFNFMLNDKKKNSKQLALILPCGLGKVKVFKDIDLKHLENLMEEYASN